MAVGVVFWWLGAILVPHCVLAANRSEHGCLTGPFDFQGKQVWDTNNTAWYPDHSIFTSNRFLSLDQSAETTPSQSRLSSPPLCSSENDTYALQFRYSIPGFLRASCYLAVSVESQVDEELRKKLVWRSSGDTLLYTFDTVSPPVRFRPCSSQFKLIFEGHGACGIFHTISIDDVSYSPLPRDDNDDHHRSHHTHRTCPDVYPDPNNSNKPLDNEIAITIIVCAAVFVVIVLVIVGVVLMVKTRSRETRRVEVTKDDCYGTFPPGFDSVDDGAPSSPDYESMDGSERVMTSPLLPAATSGRHSPYNRLGARGGGTAMVDASSTTHHYNHVGDDGLYSNLQRQQKTHRLVPSKDYNHI